MYQQVKLDELCVHKIETISSDENGLIDYFDIASVDNTKKKIISHQSLKIEEAPSRAKQIVQLNDILVSTVRPNLNAVTIIDNETKNKMVASTGFCVLRASEKIEPRYLFYFVQSPTFINSMTAQATGASYPAVSNSIVKSSHIPLPDLPIQRRIADTLDKVSDGIGVCRKMLGELDLMVKAKFGEMFGDPLINPKHYPVHQLSEHIRFLTSGSRGWAKYYSDEGEWFITIKNVKNCNISVDDVQCITPPQNAEADRTRLKEGDLLISITADLGRTGVVTKEIAEHGAYNNQHLTCIRLDQSALVPLYVAYFMESSAGKAQFEAKNMSAVKAGLNFDAIRSLKLIVPPLEQQNQFALFVTQIKKSQLTIRGIFDKMEMEKLALMQEYFNQASKL